MTDQTRNCIGLMGLNFVIISINSGYVNVRITNEIPLLNISPSVELTNDLNIISRYFSRKCEGQKKKQKKKRKSQKLVTLSPASPTRTDK